MLEHQPLGWAGWLTPRKTLLPESYHTKFRCFMSNRFGVGRVGGPLGWGVADPSNMLLLHLCYHR